MAPVRPRANLWTGTGDFGLGLDQRLLRVLLFLSRFFRAADGQVASDAPTPRLRQFRCLCWATRPIAIMPKLRTRPRLTLDCCIISGSPRWGAGRIRVLFLSADTGPLFGLVLVNLLISIVEKGNELRQHTLWFQAAVETNGRGDFLDSRKVASYLVSMATQTKIPRGHYLLRSAQIRLQTETSGGQEDCELVLEVECRPGSLTGQSRTIVLKEESLCLLATGLKREHLM